MSSYKKTSCLQDSPHRREGRYMKCKFIAVMSLLLCLLTGCGKEDAYAGPVFGDTCSGYDGFQYLEEAQLETMDGTMTLFLPKGLTMSPQKSKKGNTCDGIGVQIGQIASSGGETLSPRQCREWVRQVCEADGISRASGFHISYPKHISDTACAVPVSYYEIFGEHLKVDRTCYFQKLDNGSVLYVMVQVAEDETTEKTEGIIRVQHCLRPEKNTPADRNGAAHAGAGPLYPHPLKTRIRRNMPGNPASGRSVAPAPGQNRQTPGN